MRDQTRSQRASLASHRGAFLLPLVLALGAGSGCSESDGQKKVKSRPKAPVQPAGPSVAVYRSDKETVDIGLAYSSDIENWMTTAIHRFNSSRESKNGKYIVKVHGTKVDSTQVVDDIIKGSATPHLWVPASDVYRVQLNQRWEEKYRRGADIAPPGKLLVSSPVVVAMWKSMAEALGWPNPVGWSALQGLAVDARGWESLGHPEWGRLKLGLPNPGPSTVGRLSLLSVARAGGGAGDLTPATFDNAAVGEFVGGLERAVLHYDTATQFFVQKMLLRGPEYLHAAVTSENQVFEARNRRSRRKLPDELVAVYPADGTFMLDFPLVVLDANWVQDKHREASQVFIDFVLGNATQSLAADRYGLRPSDKSVDVTRALRADRGLDSAQPKVVLPTPTPEVSERALTMWQGVKKPADVILVIEASSALFGPRLNAVKDAAVGFLDRLGDRSRVGVVLYNDQVPATVEMVELGAARQALSKRIQDSTATGGNAFRDAVSLAHKSLPEAPNHERIRAVVALIASYDQASKLSDNDLVAQIKGPDAAVGAVPVFIISYGANYEIRLLRNIAEAGGGSLLVGEGPTISKVFAELATFF